MGKSTRMRTPPERAVRAAGAVVQGSFGYDGESIVDAPEHHEYARAFGTLTWATWDDDVRPVAVRVEDFVAAYPPDAPVRFMGGSRVREGKGAYLPGTEGSCLERFLADDGRGGSLHEMLARYGLRLRRAPPLRERAFVPSPLRETARRRNHKLRVLHGAVDVEAANMDERKAAYLDSQEKQQAAQQVRHALREMRNEQAVARDADGEKEE